MIDIAITRTTPIAELPEFLTIDEAATYLAVSRGLAYEMVRRNDLQAFRCGRLLRVPRAAIEKLLSGVSK